MAITKVVIPAAGYGTRFLPITKAIPKEMLPLLNKPALQIVIEESIASDLTHFCIIMNDNKPAIKNYFTPDEPFRALLEKAGKLHYLKELSVLLEKSTFSYIAQPEMRGLGDAIQKAQSIIKNESFGVILPDMVKLDGEPCMKPLIEAAHEHNACVIAVMEVPLQEISSYGSIKVGKKLTDNLMEVTDIIEKPKPENAYSNYAIFGRYIFTPAIFKAIDETKPHAGEIQLTDAIALLAHQGHTVLAYKIEGNIFDLGRPPGWLAANLFLGMQSAEYGDQIRKLIGEVIQKRG